MLIDVGRIGGRVLYVDFLRLVGIASRMARGGGSAKALKVKAT